MEETEERLRKDLPSTISLFSGRNTAGLHWFEAFEMHASCKKLSDDEKLLALPTKLVKTARGWWDLAIAKKPKSTWAEIKSSFLEFFATESRPDVAYDALRLLRQGDNEPTQNFLIRFHQHARFCNDTQATHLAKLFFVGLAPRGQHVLRGDVPENSTYFTIAETVIKAENFMNLQSFSINSVSEHEIAKSSPVSDVELRRKIGILVEWSRLLPCEFRREESYPRRSGRDIPSTIGL